MANDLNSNIYINANEEAINHLTKLYDKYDDCNSMAIFGKMLYGEKMEETISWFQDNMGAKWVILNYCEDNEIQITSAWHFPKESIERLYQILSEIDPDTSIEVTYMDEAYDPHGVFYISSKGQSEREGTPDEFPDEEHEDTYDIDNDGNKRVAGPCSDFLYVQDNWFNWLKECKNEVNNRK